MEKTGYVGLRKKLSDVIENWRQIKIKIAVTGESGVGKSTFINSIRGLKSDDEGAAEVDSIETTMIPTMYPHPDHPNLELWDLPGYGTITFEDKDQYLGDVKLKKYDFILLLSAKRFKSNDAWLAKEIQDITPAHHLFFVRTQMDDEIRNFKRSLSRDPTKEAVIKQVRKIRDNSSELLKKQGIKVHKVFLIDSYDTRRYDYNALVCKLIEKVDILKRDAMILSLHGITNDVIHQKLEVLRRRISSVSKAAAVAGSYSKREDRSWPIEVEIMLEEANFYREQLGLDLEALKIVAKKLRVDIESMLMKMDMQSWRFAEGEARFAIHYQSFDKFKPGIMYSFPVVGGILKTRKYQKQCELALKAFLDICAQDVFKLQRQITLSLEGGDKSIQD